jgi:hypothetical protein
MRWRTRRAPVASLSRDNPGRVLNCLRLAADAAHANRTDRLYQEPTRKPASSRSPNRHLVAAYVHVGCWRSAQVATHADRMQHTFTQVSDSSRYLITALDQESELAGTAGRAARDRPLSFIRMLLHGLAAVPVAKPALGWKEHSARYASAARQHPAVGSADTRVRLRPFGGKRTPHPLEGCAFTPFWCETYALAVGGRVPRH